MAFEPPARRRGCIPSRRRGFEVAAAGVGLRVIGTTGGRGRMRAVFHASCRESCLAGCDGVAVILIWPAGSSAPEDESQGEGNQDRIFHQATPSRQNRDEVAGSFRIDWRKQQP